MVVRHVKTTIYITGKFAEVRENDKRINDRVRLRAKTEDDKTSDAIKGYLC